jgi:hypothetical protein
MLQLKEYTHPRINKAVEHLYSQTYLTTHCKQVAADDGDQELAEKFAMIEALARLAVEELRLFDTEAPASHEANTSSVGGLDSLNNAAFGIPESTEEARGA